MERLLDYQAEPGALRARFGWLVEGLDGIGTLISLAAVLLLILGAVRFILGVARAEISRDRGGRVRRVNALRVELGRAILSALELFIVADIIRTALSLAFADILFLGALVVIRSIISWFLDRELDQLKQEMKT